MSININDLETGDILLFRGTTWYDYLIEYLGYSPYSHVAMVLNKILYISPFLRDIYTLESGMENVPDAEDKKIKFGVQINKLQDVLAKCQDKSVYVRKLTCNRTPEFFEELKNIHTEIHNKPYDVNIIDWLEAKLLVNNNDIKKTQEEFKDNNVQKTNTFWCSALITYIYTQLGLVELKDKTIKEIPWTIIATKEFSKDGNVLLNFINCSLGDELLLK